MHNDFVLDGLSKKEVGSISIAAPLPIPFCETLCPFVGSLPPGTEPAMFAKSPLSFFSFLRGILNPLLLLEVLIQPCNNSVLGSFPIQVNKVAHTSKFFQRKARHFDVGYSGRKFFAVMKSLFDRCFANRFGFRFVSRVVRTNIESHGLLVHLKPTWLFLSAGVQRAVVVGFRSDPLFVLPKLLSLDRWRLRELDRPLQAAS